MDTSAQFKLNVRVYYEDTDAGGVVYHARYLHFLERARTEWLRQFGFNQIELKEQSTVFVVRDMALKFVKPARLDDLLTVTVDVTAVKNASLHINQTIFDEQGQKLLAQVTIACLDARQFKPKPLPSDVRQIIQIKEERKESISD